MKKVITMAGAALLAVGVAGAAFAQANPNAPEPNSAGTGVYTPGTSPTRQAIDTPEDRAYVPGNPSGREARRSGTVGMSSAKKSKPEPAMKPQNGSEEK
jgi:hypothetical protein